jgi:protein tyrosine phosphatase
VINASWIHLPFERSFISAQAPLKNTIDDFWTMCFDYNINVIIMLCKLEEDGKEKCVEYWEPEKKDILESVNDCIESIFKINYTTEDINEDITIRTCHVINKKTNEEREIQQIHYGGWPDHEIPKDIQMVYGNILFMFNIVDKFIGNSPICVHCSAGVGRTGTFIALYNLYRDILIQIRNENKKSITFSLMNLVRKLKEMRLHLVENFKQYELIYEFISKLLKDRN